MGAEPGFGWSFFPLPPSPFPQHLNLGGFPGWPGLALCAVIKSRQCKRDMKVKACLLITSPCLSVF